MQYTNTTNFSTCLSGKVPSTHFEIPSSTKLTTLLAVEISLFLTVQIQLLFQSPANFLILSYNLSLCCQVAKAWSILLIPIKAIQFFSFIFFSNLIFYLIIFLRLTIYHILNILWVRIYFDLVLKLEIQVINLSIQVVNNATLSIYSKGYCLCFEITSCITDAIYSFCLTRCYTLYRKMSLPRWNQNSSSFLLSDGERQ